MNGQAGPAALQPVVGVGCRKRAKSLLMHKMAAELAQEKWRSEENAAEMSAVPTMIIIKNIKYAFFQGSN